MPVLYRGRTVGCVGTERKPRGANSRREVPQVDLVSAFEQLGPGFYIALVGGAAAWWFFRIRDDEEDE